MTRNHRLMPGGRADDHHRCRRCVLRPVRRGHQRGPVPGVRRTPGRVARLLQRDARLLGAEPLRGHRPGAARSRDVHLRSGRHPRADQVRHRDAQGHPDLRRPADAHDAPAAPVARVHAPARRRARVEDPRVHCPVPRPLRGRGGLRLHRAPGRTGAHEDDQHAARHPRERPGARARPGGRQPAHRAGQAHGGRRGAVRQRADVRRVPRLADGAPLRRHHDGAAQRDLRGRDRHDQDART